MKNTLRGSTGALLIALLIVQAPFVMASNWVAGVGTTSSVGEWSNYSAINIIAGPTIFPLTSTKTVFYIAFTGGTEADIGNMVLYTTATRQSTIASVTPVTLGGVKNPTIDLTNKKVCKTQPVSAANPCVIKLDPVTLKLLPQNDYYFVIYFVSDSNNGSLVGASSQAQNSSLTGLFESGDETQLKVGNSAPTPGGGNAPYFLVAVQTS
jgi:hypothetical protein